MRTERHNDHGTVTRADQVSAHFVSENDLGIVQNIPRPDWLPLADSPAREPDARGHRLPRRSLGKSLAAGRQVSQRSIDVAEPERRAPDDEELPDACDDALSDNRRVESFGKGSRHSRQLLRCASPSLGLLVKAGVVNADSSLTSYDGKKLDLFNGEFMLLFCVDNQVADKFVFDD